MAKPPKIYFDKREPSLKIGNVVRLNTGGYPMLVVDVWSDRITVAWKEKSGKIKEADMHKTVVHRVRDSW